METDFFNIDIGSNPYFSPQEMGDGQYSLGDAQGENWMDWNNIPEDIRNQFLSYNDNASQVSGMNSTTLNQDALQNYLTSTGSSLKESQFPGGYKNTGNWLRGMFDNKNNVVGKLTQGMNGAWQDELGFNLTAMFLNPFGGIATGGAAGGIGGSLSNNASTATAINAGSASAASAAGAGAEDRDILKAGVTGAASTYSPNVAQYFGVENQHLQNAINSSARNAAVAAVNDGDVGAAAAQGALPGLAQYLGGQMNFDTLDDLPGTLGGTMSDADGENSVTMGGYSSPAQQQANAQLPQDVKQRSSSEGGGFKMPELGAFFDKLIPSSPEQFGDLAQGLMGLYSGYRQRRSAKDLRNQIGGNRGAYEQQLNKSLQRRDAASGRRSNYGGRAVELQAALAQLDSRNAPALQAADAASLGGLVNMFQSGLRYAGKQGAFGDKYNPNVPTAPSMGTMLPSTWTNMPTQDYSLGSNLQLGDQNKRRIFGGGS